MLQAVKPRNARSARAVAKREPLPTENPRITLFLRAPKCSEILQLLMRDLNLLKQPYTKRFTKKNAGIHPFEDPSSLEFFSNKNDASLIVFGSHSKKRPHTLTMMRMFDYKVLDMVELLVNADTLRTMGQFKIPKKPGVGLKPMVAFSGAAFESPVQNQYTIVKSLLLDLFRGPDVKQVDVEGLQYVISVSVGEEVPGQPSPEIKIRAYMIRTKRAGGGAKLPRVEVEEMGPRVDFRIGRVREADEGMWKEAMKRPKQQQRKGVDGKAEMKQRKNVETDLMGDKLGRIHVGKQNLGKLQTRKMKGLKRGRDELETGDDAGGVPLNGEDLEVKKLKQ
ncbi:MAG: rRNA-binding ribosome biosynthesis protein rpf2 [Alyxoria varia]|nr:MAG: rRNA-binding ribosome biosynthesis protein rpf2 [Alyxoria varia]